MGKRNRRGRPRTKAPVTLSAAPQAANRWDMGTGTRTQKLGLVVEDADYIDPETGEKVNPNGVKRARRIDVAESYHKRGKLDDRQLRAAQALRGAYEATMKSPPAIKKVQVDTTPKPDQHIDIIVDRISKFSAIMRHVPATSKPVVDAVVLENNSVGWLPQYRGRKHSRGMELLQSGLNAVADALEY
jgi:hypothetical protein